MPLGTRPPMPHESCDTVLKSTVQWLLSLRYPYNVNPPPFRQARFTFKRNRLRCVRCVNENRMKRKRLRWQAANRNARSKQWQPRLAACQRAFLAVFVYATQAIAFEWKPGFTRYQNIISPHSVIVLSARSSLNATERLIAFDIYLIIARA